MKLEEKLKKDKVKNLLQAMRKDNQIRLKGKYWFLAQTTLDVILDVIELKKDRDLVKDNIITKDNQDVREKDKDFNKISNNDFR